MTWLTLGTLSPGYQWQIFNTPVLEGDLFRITQQWQGSYPGIGPAWLASLYANAGESGYRKFFSNSDPQLIEMPIPEEFRSAGLFVRYIQLKLGIRTRLYEGANWQVTLELWTGTTSPAGEAVQLVSGGTYDGT